MPYLQRIRTIIVWLYRAVERWWFVVLPLLVLLIIWGWEWQPLRCPIRAVTGHPCPGCGMLRALRALSQGAWAMAWHYNPLSYLLVTYTLGMGVLAMVYRIRGIPLSRLRQMKIPLWVIGLLALLVLLNGIRNWYTIGI